MTLREITLSHGARTASPIRERVQDRRLIVEHEERDRAAAVRNWIARQLEWEHSLETLRESDEAAHRDRGAEGDGPARAA